MVVGHGRSEPEKQKPRREPNSDSAPRTIHCSVACGGRGRDVLLTRPDIWKELDPPRPEAVPPVLEPESGRLLVKQVIQASRPLGIVRQIARLKHCKRRASLWPVTKVRSLAATAVSGTSTGRFAKLRRATSGRPR